MQLLPNVPAAIPARPSPVTRGRIVTTVAAVALAHAVLILLVMRETDKPTPTLAIESPVISAQLLSPSPHAAAPVALESAPPAPRPALKKKLEPSPKPLHAPPAPSRTFVRNAPAQPPAPPAAAAPADNAPAHEAPSPAPTQSPAPQAQAAAPAQGRETLAISAPKNVSHLDCRIVKPDYPALSHRRGETGTAEVRFVIGLTGAIESVELAKSSGYPRLDDAALAAMRASTCHPYLENGAAVRAAYTQPFAFTFDD